jgi:hypothetical protein
MRTPALRSPRDILLSVGTAATATAATMLPLCRMCLPPTCRRPRRPTADRNQPRRRHLQRLKDMSRHCIARNMRHQRRRLPSRHNTIPHTRQRMVLSSIRGRRILPMASPPPKVPHILRRARMRRILCNRKCLSGPITPLTRTPSPAEPLGRDPSPHPCRHLQPAPRPPLSFRGTQQMLPFQVDQWTTCQKSRIGGSMEAARRTFRSLKTA